MSNKRPSFQFYPADFLADFNVQSMSLDERGMYITLLCHCWLEDGLAISDGNPMWPWINNEKIFKCFFEKNGKFRNKRLDRERIKQDKYYKSLRKRGLKGAEARWLGHKKKMARPMAENGSSSSSSSNIYNKNYKYNDDDMFLVGKMLEHLERINPNLTVVKKMTPERQKKWANSFRIIREQDGRTLQEIGDVIDLAMGDKFWRGVILSPDNLRKHWDKLVMLPKRKEEDEKKTDWTKAAAEKFRE